jgi:hypothetical protein
MMDAEDNDARHLRCAEFARMSTSKKLSLLAIRKAQLSSRKKSTAVDAPSMQKSHLQKLRRPIG